VTANLRDQLQATLSGSYTLERELGGGGMSRVFVADELRLKRKVVVKVLSPELAQGISVERFEREIQTAAALQHANIVPVLSAGDTNGLPFYTMPFVEGESLRGRLGRGPLAVTEVIGILRDVTRALAYAHQHGVVHRDIKPDNVLLAGGAAVVTDFGIAKAISASRTASGGATLTQIGTSIGTPAYMAPEQAAGDPDIDQRADIYALGAMAYELLSGQAVFANRTPQRMLAAHMGEAPRGITEFRGDLPHALADMVMQCLAKDAKDRPQQASDIARVLETITSGSGMQSMSPVLLGGPGMFRRALAIYAAAFVAVAILAKAAIVGIGLPDWVFPGSLIVMALGLPVVLWTGYVQRVAHRAMTMTPTYTPGGSPSLTRGTIATMALKAAPKMSWYRTARGGLYAFGSFIAVITAFMAMRALGIGPFGSLLASGALNARNRVIITDFTVSGGDSTLGRVVSDAVRAGLNESSVFALAAPSEIASALQRMQRPGSSRVNLVLAREIAQREGIKAIIDGDVAAVGGSYILAIRLVTADSGKELTSQRATAAGPDKLIDAADQVARALRGKAGESLRRVQGAPPLAQVTTSSLEALRKYSEGSRLNDVERDFLKAVTPLREAVAIDSTFAEGWRKLGVVLSNAGLPEAQSDSAITRAYHLRNRLSEHERDIITAYWFSTGPGRDRAKAISVYDAMLARGDSAGNLNNVALLLMSRREFARAETLYRAGIRATPGSQLIRSNAVGALYWQGKLAEAESAITANRARFPGASVFRQQAVTVPMMARGQLDDVQHALDSARKVRDPVNTTWTLNVAAGFALQRGRIGEWRSLSAQARQADSALGRTVRGFSEALSQLEAVSGARLPSDAELRALDAALAKYPIERLPVNERPYLRLANALAFSGHPDRARAMLAMHNAEVKDTTLRRAREPDVRGTEATIALAERRWRDAIDDLRRSDRLPDGPNGACAHCLSFGLIWTYFEAGMADSALAEYEAYRRTPLGARKREGPDLNVGAQLYERIAKLYDAKGNADMAAEHYRDFIELWKNADPELQPRVAAARERLKKLQPVERPKHE